MRLSFGRHRGGKVSVFFLTYPLRKKPILRARHLHGVAQGRGQRLPPNMAQEGSCSLMSFKLVEAFLLAEIKSQTSIKRHSHRNGGVLEARVEITVKCI